MSKKYKEGYAERRKRELKKEEVQRKGMFCDCPGDGIVVDMERVMQYQISSCDGGCCPNYLELWQCPTCKTVKSY